MTDERRFYEAPAAGAKRSAPAALRNREPIAEVLNDWLPRITLGFRWLMYWNEAVTKPSFGL